MAGVSGDKMRMVSNIQKWSLPYLQRMQSFTCVYLLRENTNSLYIYCRQQNAVYETSVHPYLVNIYQSD